MPFIEAPTTFYIGRRFDPTTRRLIDEIVYYDSRDLTTHAVVVGMTGSGKTGLCITLLEEAVMDNIPSIVIDPKGDITNLMLTFPELRPEDFEPWVNIDDARRAGLEVDEYAREVADQWRDGLASWSITPQRLQRLKQNARFSIYTPGSDAGLPVSILDAMHAPEGGFHADEELHRERISGIVTALLALIGKQVEPVKDREHVLIANIFEHAWRQGEDLTLEDVILRVQKPPFQKLGVFDVNTFFPEKDRFALAMELNNIIAAPSFQSWLQGEPLDIQSLLYTPEGKPRVSIFYIAHLNEAERMFIVTLLLENMLAWMRTLSGTTSLRSILYFDEMFGFFPPHPYNPPSKEPLLRLLKQARAFGVGLVLATQNPGDLDYKGLSNAGTWFIGKLQTENDKNRVLTGLESLQSANHPFDIDDIDRLLSTIDPRVFILHNVHDNGGAFPFYTRWAMSYLRGPLTRQQIRTLMADQRQQPYYQTYAQLQAARGAPAPPDRLPEESRLGEAPRPTGATPPPETLPELDEPPSTPRPSTLPDFAPPVRPQPDAGEALQAGPVEPSGPAGPTIIRARASAALPEGINHSPPPLPSSIAQSSLPPHYTPAQVQAAWQQKTGQVVPLTGSARLVYHPLLIAQADVRYSDRKADLTFTRTYAYYVPDVPAAGLIHWDEHQGNPVDPKLLSLDPAADAAFADLPPGLADSKRLTALKSDVVDFIYRTGSVALPYNPALDFIGGPDMRRRDFLVQAQALARQRRDEAIDEITRRYDDQFDKIEAKLRRIVRGLAGEREQLEAAKNEEMFTTGEALLSLLRGRTTYTLSRVSRTRRYKSYIQEDIYESEAQIAELERQLEETELEMQRALAEVNAQWGEAATLVEEYRLTPYKKDIYLSVFGIGWQPSWLVVANGLPALLPAWAS